MYFVAYIQRLNMNMHQNQCFDIIIQSMQQQKQYTCKFHTSPVVSICTSPACDHFKLMCEWCIDKHKSEHMSWSQVYEQALRLGRLGLTGLQGVKARKNQQMDENINNNPGLVQLQSKLDEISKLINLKLQKFRSDIKRIYSQHVKQRLDELDQMVYKSQQLLQRYINQLQNKNYTNLHVFFKNDFLHEVKYFQSYFNQIFVKKIRSFKTAIENDRIFSLLTNFQQSLHKIFAISKEGPIVDQIRQSHLFANEEGHCQLYTFSQNLKSLISQPIAAMNRISHSRISFQDLQGKYMWDGKPQSIYYPQVSCYYIIGQGNKCSKLIVKYQYRKGVDQAFKVVKSMETERRYFGVCLLNGEIYIIGGQNDKQGCLVKCQKFVPVHNNQVYIIHSLRQRSSRHSITTYKDRYILKFGGIKRPIDGESYDQQFQNAASPEIYSLKTEEWIAVPFKNKMHFNIYPTIFKAEHRNFILVLGGDPVDPSNERYRPAFQLILQESMGGIDQVKIRQRQSKIEYSEHIFNSTIALLDEDNECVFIKERKGKVPQIGRYKIQF